MRKDMRGRKRERGGWVKDMDFGGGGGEGEEGGYALLLYL